MYDKGISLVICCYNSATRLQQTLQYIANQKTTISWEIIVIDNNSSDDTFFVAQEYWDNYKGACNADFQVLKESRPGKSYALETGIAKSKYSYILICDDDNWLDSNYLAVAFDIMETHLEIGIAGGKCLPVFETDPPDWIDRYIGGYACSSPEYEPSKYVKMVFGAGMIIRKSILDELNNYGFKNILSSQRGVKITNGEDAELCKVFELLGLKTWFDDRLLLRHFIPKEKLNWQYCKKLFASFGHSSVLLTLYDKVLSEQNNNDKLSFFYWIRNFLFYFLIRIKYYPKYKNRLDLESSEEAIRYLSWELQMKEYWRLKWKLNTYYNDIINLKKNFTAK